MRSIHHRLNHRACVHGLGLRRIRTRSWKFEDTPATRGMLNKVSTMVKLVGKRDMRLNTI